MIRPELLPELAAIMRLAQQIRIEAETMLTNVHTPREDDYHLLQIEELQAQIIAFIASLRVLTNDSPPEEVTTEEP